MDAVACAVRAQCTLHLAPLYVPVVATLEDLNCFLVSDGPESLRACVGPKRLGLLVREMSPSMKCLGAAREEHPLLTEATRLTMSQSMRCAARRRCTLEKIVPAREWKASLSAKAPAVLVRCTASLHSCENFQSEGRIVPARGWKAR